MAALIFFVFAATCYLRTCQKYTILKIYTHSSKRYGIFALLMFDKISVIQIEILYFLFFNYQHPLLLPPIILTIFNSYSFYLLDDYDHDYVKGKMFRSNQLLIWLYSFDCAVLHIPNIFDSYHFLRKYMKNHH